MEIILAALLPTAVLGFLLWRADRRFDEAQKAWRLERVGLLNRIAAPGVVPAEDAPEPSGDVLYLPQDDDTAFEEYLEAQRAGEVA